MHKFHPEDEAAVKSFVEDGYVVYNDIFDLELIADIREFILSRVPAYREGMDMYAMANGIMDELECSPLYETWVHTANLKKMAQHYVGPDIAWIAYDTIFINLPNDTDPVMTKGWHQDLVTGTGVDTVFAKTFFTDVDAYNGMSVIPGSHLQGLQPVRNRKPQIDLLQNGYKAVNLDTCKAGDVMVWHSLTMHATTGHSPTNTRISISSRFKSTEGPMTSQERALGYRSLGVGPLNHVKRYIGNDYLMPFRTMGGAVKIDKHLTNIYGG